MPTSSITLDSPIPPHLDLAGAPSQLFQVPPSPSASSALYRSIAVPPRKRARSSLETRSSWLQVDGSASPLVTSVIGSDDLLHGVDNVVDLDYRPSRYREPSDPLHLDTSVDSLGEAGGLRRKRSHPDPYLIAASPTGSDEKEQSPSVTSYPSAAPVRWSKAVLGVVGKVWDFCWSGAFRGFYAGGGRGYTMSGEQEEEDDDDNSMTFPSLASEKGSAPTTPSAQPPRRGPSTPLPGCYPEETDLQGNWVMVSPPSATIYRGSTPRRGLRRTTTAAHLAARRARPHTRRVLMSHAPPSLPSQHYFSSPAMPRESPVSVNSKRHMAEKRRLEREEDASLQRMEQRLQVLIREGTQALATRVEVMDSEMED